MSASVINEWNVIQELLQFLRNQDILTTTQRGVTTTTITGTYTSATEHIISVTNARNIRSLSVGGTPLVYGADYQVDFTYDNSGTVACRITFTVAQSGSYSITYDYGTDKLFEDFPQEFLTVAAFPRIAIGLAPSPSRDGGLGNINEVDVYFQVNIYDTDKKNVHNYATTIRQKLMDNWTSFYYLKGPIKSRGRSPTIFNANGNNKIFMVMNEFVSLFNYEKA